MGIKDEVTGIFDQPENANVTVWRYQDLSKLLSLLHTRSLSLCNVSMFHDPLEGSLPKKAFEALEKECGDHAQPEEARKEGSLNRLRTRQNMYASCWHLNVEESLAMWRSYSALQQGIALQTTYGRLVESVFTGRGKAVSRGDTVVGIVRYIDYEEDTFPLDNVYYPFIHKQRHFDFEREVRVLKELHPFADDPPKTIHIPLEPEKLIEKIIVSPYAEDWYFDLVKSAVGQYVNCEVVWSEIRIKPLY